MKWMNGKRVVNIKDPSSMQLPQDVEKALLSGRLLTPVVVKFFFGRANRQQLMPEKVRRLRDVSRSVQATNLIQQIRTWEVEMKSQGISSEINRPPYIELKYLELERLHNRRKRKQTHVPKQSEAIGESET